MILVIGITQTINQTKALEITITAVTQMVASELGVTQLMKINDGNTVLVQAVQTVLMSLLRF